MAAVTQIRNKHSEGRAYYDRKVAEGKTREEALRALKRRISDAIYAGLQDDARRTGRRRPGRATGERLCIQRGRLTPRIMPALRMSHSRT
jgi:transposase